jgi:uncharacterized protein YegL
MKRSNRRSILAAACALLAVAGTDWYGAASLHAAGTCGAMDVVFVIDTTGSMGGAIANVKAALDPIMDQIEDASGGDYRLGLVTFKDNVTVEEDFPEGTGNRVSVTAKINALGASGGGGEPEASDEALNTVINGLDGGEGRPGQIGNFGDFRSTALKLVILITDARPAGFDDTFTPGVDDANAHARAVEAQGKSIRISAVFVPTCPTCEGNNATIRAIMEDYAETSGGVFKETASNGTGTADAITDIIAACGSGDLCNEDGSPNGIDEDEDGIVDDGCFVEKDLLFEDNEPQRAKFDELDEESRLGNIRTNSLVLTHQYGVTDAFTLTVRATIKNPNDTVFDPDVFDDATCDLVETTSGPPACVVYEVIRHEGGGDPVAGDRAVKWQIEYFRPTGDEVTRNPVMGYSAGCGPFDKSILNLFTKPDPIDPIGIGYTDDYGSCVGMGTIPEPAEGAEEACHEDNSPNGIDEDGDGLLDEGCRVTRSFQFSPGVGQHTFEFNDLGNVKPNSVGLDHFNGVTAPFTLNVIAEIVDPAILSFGGEFPGITKCAFNNTQTGDNFELPCVRYEVDGGVDAPFNDGVNWTLTYFAPLSESAQKQAGMGYSAGCENTINDNILTSFQIIPGDDADPIGIGYTDDYGSCVVMTATDPPPPVLHLPADITTIATSAAGAVVTYTATATGVIDGVLQTFNATCVPPSGSLFPIGQTTVNCHATDSAGQTTTGSFKVNVNYGICALYDTERPKKAGSTIPIKLNVCTADGTNISSPDIVLHAVSLTKLSNSVDGPPEDPGNSQPDLDFRFTGGSYHFNLKTTGLGKGTYTLNFTVGGAPTIYKTRFEIK